MMSNMTFYTLLSASFEVQQMYYHNYIFPAKIPVLGKITIFIMKPSHFLISIVWKGLNILCFSVAQSFEPLGPHPKASRISVGCSGFSA